MRFRVVLVCYRCGERRGVVIRLEQGKRRGYCRGYADFTRGKIPDSEAPPERASTRAQRTGWMRPFQRAEKPDI
jgi:hypothetical protein